MRALTETKVFGVLKASTAEEFPVDFDDAWQWIGYSTKQKAAEALKANLIEGVDFLTSGLKNAGGRGRPAKDIRLSIDGFKMFCMMAGTPEGRQVRLYFLECQKKLEEITEQDQKQKLIELCVSPIPRKWTKVFEDEYYNQLFRLTGLKRTGAGRPWRFSRDTEDLVYQWLPGNISQALRVARKESSDKLHQYLTSDGLELYRRHMSMLLPIMAAAATIGECKLLLMQAKTKTYQLVLV